MLFTKGKIFTCNTNIYNSDLYSDLQLSVLVQVSRFSHFIKIPLEIKILHAHLRV